MIRFALAVVAACVSGVAMAEIPLIINHQGVVKVNGLPFSGTGQFKFGFVNGDGEYVWTNDGTRVGQLAGLSPASPLSLTVTNGSYSVRLGDTSVSGMEAIASTVFNAADLKLRVYFNDGVNGEQALSPDQIISSSAYAYHAIVADTTPGSLDGGIISNDTSGDVTNDLRVSKVICRDASNVGNIVVEEMVKRVDATWVAGDGNGGLDTGTVGASNVIVYVWAIGDSTGTNPGDILLSKSGTAPVMPSGYNLKRLLGGRGWGSTAWWRFQSVGTGRDRWVYLHDPRTVISISGSTVPTTFTDLNCSEHIPTVTCQLATFNGNVGRAGATAGLFIRSKMSVSSFPTYAVYSTSLGGGTTQISDATTFTVALDSNGVFQYATPASLPADTLLLRVSAYLENL